MCKHTAHITHPEHDEWELFDSQHAEYRDVLDIEVESEDGVLGKVDSEEDGDSVTIVEGVEEEVEQVAREFPDHLQLFATRCRLRR